MANAAGPAPEITATTVSKTIEAHRAERPPVRRPEMFQRLGYRVIEDEASRRIFTQTFQQDFPQVNGKNAINPEEMNSQIRSRIRPPECTTLETPEGERLWALSFGDRMTVIVGSAPVVKNNEDDTAEIQTYPIRNYLLGPRKGGGKAIDLLSSLHAYDKRWGRTETEAYLSFGYVDPHFYLEGADEKPIVILPLAIKREGQTPVIDIDNTTNALLHEESHAARRVVDKAIGESEPVTRVAAMHGEKAGQTLTAQVRERGAHAIGLLVAHRLREYIDTGSYKRLMHKALETYHAKVNPVRAVH